MILLKKNDKTGYSLIFSKKGKLFQSRIYFCGLKTISMTRWIVFIIIVLVFEVYTYQVFKTGTKGGFFYGVSLLLTILSFGFLWYQFTGDRRETFSPNTMYAMGIFLTIFAPKLLFFGVLLIEDIVRVFGAIVDFFIDSSEGVFLKGRRTFISQWALALSAIPFGVLLMGMMKGKYNYKVLRYSLSFDDLPDAFDGYQLTQISDIHCGSFDNPSKIEYAVDLINSQGSDLLLFTGDFVNNTASEMVPWKEVFSKISAKDGKYSVLGNHDYGDYVQWKTPQEKEQNMELLMQLQKEMGFDLLLNESRYIEKENSRIALVGVENWGKGGFKKKGDLRKATQNIHVNDFKILLSHDPSHWEEKVLPDTTKYQLTLSGHTHGMQFGIEIPGWIKWSPVKWRYKYWAGIYKKAGQYINVIRGFGYLAYPGRVGIWPEITVITLKKSDSSA